MYAVCLSVCLCVIVYMQSVCLSVCVGVCALHVYGYISIFVMPKCYHVVYVSVSHVCVFFTFFFFFLSFWIYVDVLVVVRTRERARVYVCVCFLGTTHRLASQQALFVSTGISFIGYMYLVTNSHLYYTLSWRCYCGSNASRPSKCLLHTVVEEQQKVSNTDRHTDNVRRGLHSRPVASSHSDATHTISSHH